MRAFFSSCPDIPKQAPSLLLPWLTHPGSLTAKLKDARGDAHVQVIKQDWRLANCWDGSVLGIHRHPVLQRDILMRSNGIPCWFARSVIPQSTFTSNTGVFKRLDNEALGDIVFNHAQIERTSLTHYAICSHCIEYYWPASGLVSNATSLWLRLSTFSIRRHFPFFLAELFLPTMLEVLQ